MNQSDYGRNASMLKGSLAKRGYMSWWHSFQGIDPITQNTRTFFIEYFMINPAFGQNQPILGNHPHHKKRGIRPTYFMIKSGVFPKEKENGIQLSAYYPISTCKVVKDPFYLQIEKNVLSENRICGSVEVSLKEASKSYLMSDCGTMEWDLEVYKSIACHTGRISGSLSNACNVLDSYWHGEGIRTDYKGTVIVNGITYQITPQESFGYADKHWGKSYPRPLLQLASCQLRSQRTGKLIKHSALALDGCSPRVFGFSGSPKLLLQLTYAGEDFCFSFARPKLLSHIRWKKKETSKRLIWHIKAQNKYAVAKLSVNCLKQDMLPLQYETPLGTLRKTSLLASGAGQGAIELFRIVPEGLQWIDTLQIENALCKFQPQ